MALHDPNTPETPPPNSGSDQNHDDRGPDEIRNPLMENDDQLPPADSSDEPLHTLSDEEEDVPFEQEDIAEPFEVAIDDMPVEDETPEIDEAFQQRDIAEPFDSAIPEDVLEEPETPILHHVSQELFQQKDIAEPYDLTADSQTNIPKVPRRPTEPLLFDDDYSRPATPISAATATFQAEEFGPSVPMGSRSTPVRATSSERGFEDLTLSEVVSLFVRRPFATWGALYDVLTDASDSSKKNDALVAEGLALEAGVGGERSEFSVLRTLYTFVFLPIVVLYNIYAIFNPNAPTFTWLSTSDSSARRTAVEPTRLGLKQVVPGLQLIAYVFALWGCLYLISSTIERRQENIQLAEGLPFLLRAFGVWLAAEVIQHREGISAWFKSRRPTNWLLMVLRLIPLILWIWVLTRWFDASDEPLDQTPLILDMITPTFPVLLLGLVAWVGIDLLGWALRSLFPASLRPPNFTEIPSSAITEDAIDSEDLDEEGKPKKRKIMGLHIPRIEDLDPIKIACAGCGTFLAAITYVGSANNRMSDPVFYAWIASVVLWAFALSPNSWRPRRWLVEWQSRLREQLRWRPSPWMVLATIGIVVLAVWMRTDRLYGSPVEDGRIPPEMTSDHVEKILDAQRVLEGASSEECFALPACNRDIFFANNGGREPFQMYALAFIANLTGRDVNYDLLKTLALFESLLTLPIIGWFAWEILATEKRSLRLTFAFVAMGLVAVSFWHLNITRLSLRIVLTPAVTALLLIYLSRGMRSNNRADFIKAGICLGVGLYMYQAVRMLPVVIVLGVAIAAYFGTTYWRERGRYVFNLAALVLISFVIFVPLFHYSVENPDMFLRRTAGRLFGDDVVTTRLADGTIVERQATLEEQVTAFRQNIPVLLSNMRNAVLMFHWKGDVAWINNAPNWPALDPFVGALLILGTAAWASLAIRRGDVVYAFMPVVILVMLLPSALSIAYPIENPSFTRTSGALPAVFLLAAYPLALFIEQLNHLIRRYEIRRLLQVAVASIMLLAYNHSMSLYTTTFVQAYEASSLPYSQAGRILKGFAESDGGFGNAFMIAYMYWWDHRALGLEAGLTDWPNGIISREAVPSFLRDSAERRDPRYRLDPTKDLLFFYAISDLETSAQLKSWFPQGHERQIVTYQTGDDFMLYRVPALGQEGFAAFLQQAIAP